MKINCDLVFPDGQIPEITIGFRTQLHFQLVDVSNQPLPFDTPSSEITLSLLKNDGTQLVMKLSDSSGIVLENLGKYGQFMADVSPTNSALLAPGPGDGLANMFLTYTIPGVNDGDPVPLNLKSSVYVVQPDTTP